MKATNLLEVYDIFDPQEPLIEEKLKEFYVERASPIENIRNAMIGAERPSKVLFTGHRGGGKTTELNRLIEEIQDDFFIVSFSVKDKLNIFDLEHTDILLIIAAEIYENVIKEVKLDKSLVKELDAWTTKSIIESIEEKEKGIKLGAGFSAIVNLGGKIGKQVTTRGITRKIIEPRLSDLIDRMNRVIYDSESKLDKKILVVIDDLDKMDLEPAEKLFYGYGGVLTQPKCKIIYTIPQALLYSNKMRQIILQHFENSFTLPNIKIFRRDGGLNEYQYELMKSIAFKRMESYLISEDSIDVSIKCCGGILSDFIRMIGKASNVAYTKGKGKIEREDISQVISELRSDYMRVLRREDYEMLEEVGKEKQKTDGEQFQDLLFNLAIIEYSDEDGETWYDLHPAIKGLV